jgi:hypothetical protein
VPALAKNLLAPVHLGKASYSTLVNNAGCQIFHTTTRVPLYETTPSNGMLIVPLIVQPATVNHITATSTVIPLQLLHHHFSHVSKEHLMCMVESSPDLCDAKITGLLSNCVPCTKGKFK